MKREKEILFCEPPSNRKEKTPAASNLLILIGLNKVKKRHHTAYSNTTCYSQVLVLALKHPEISMILVLFSWDVVLFRFHAKDLLKLQFS